MSFMSLSKERIEYLTHNVRKCSGVNYVTGQASPVAKKEGMDTAASKLRTFRGMIYGK